MVGTKACNKRCLEEDKCPKRQCQISADTCLVEKAEKTDETKAGQTK